MLHPYSEIMIDIKNFLQLFELTTAKSPPSVKNIIEDVQESFFGDKDTTTNLSKLSTSSDN